MSIVNEKTAAWIAAHRLDLRTEAGIQIARMITEELDQKDSIIAKRDARIADLEKALEWYANNVSDCRKLGADGDAAKAKLDMDGGFYATSALESKP